MKKLVLVFVFCLVSSYAFAEETISTATETTVPAVTDETIEISGTVIDNMCAGEQTPEQLADFIMMHDKSCALMSHCAGSGYAIFADGKLSKFDADSNAKIEEFLNKDDSRLDVVVTAKKTGEELSLVSIENQK